MTTGLLTTIAGRNAIIADLGGGADLVLTHVAWGDANGVPYAPNEAQTALVNEKYRATIASVAVVAGAIVVDAIIPADTNDGSGRPSHGFNVAEVGLFSAAGTLIGLARCGNGYKPPPASGQAADVTYRLKLAVANPSAIAVTVDPQAQIAIGRHVRAPWITVDGIQNAPPGAPAPGATYLIGPAPTGAWAGFAHRIAQWIGVWTLAEVPAGHQVVDASKDRYAGNRWLERTATGWEAGVTRVIQAGAPNWVGTFAGSANVLTATLDPVPSGLRPGLTIAGLLPDSNTGAATLNLNSLGAKAIVYNADGTPLARSEMRAGEIAVMRYDGTAWRLTPSQTRQPSGRKNALINPAWAVSQHNGPGWPGGVLAAGVYGYDRWKGGAGGATIALSAAVLTISAGSIIQVVEASGFARGPMTLSWTGDAQARINGSAWSSSPLTVNLATDVHVTVEFKTGTLSRPQFEPGLFATSFEQREFADEVNLCRRYCETILHSQRFTAQAANEVVRQTVPLVPKIAAPTIKVGNAGVLTNAVVATAVGDTNYSVTLAVQATAAGVCEVASRSLLVVSEL